MIQSINIIDLPQLLGKEGVICIDVRTPSEYQQKHIKGVQNMPLDVVTDYLPELAQHKTVYVHCKTGGRAMQACIALQQAGLQQVVHVDGSIDGSEEAGLLVWVITLGICIFLKHTTNMFTQFFKQKELPFFATSYKERQDAIEKLLSQGTMKSGYYLLLIIPSRDFQGCNGDRPERQWEASR